MPSFFRRDRVLLVLILVVVTLLALPLLTYPLGRDQGEFATIGRGILDGRVPYRDLWNPKPPAVFYVYALAMTLFGRTVPALRAIDLFIVPVISWALFWLAKCVSTNRVALWAALLFPVFYFTETFWTLTQNDGIVLLPMVLAMICLFKASSSSDLSMNAATSDGNASDYRSFSPSSFTGKGSGDGVKHAPNTQSNLPHYLWPFLAGALSAYVVWFKYPFALFMGVLVLGYLFLRPKTATDAGRFLATGNWKLAASFAFGLLLIGGGGILYLASIGAWNDLLESARVTSQYTALTFNLTDFAGLLGTALGFRWRQWGVLWILAVLWFIAPRFGGERRGRGWWVILLWLLAGLAIMLVQAKAYDYHWLPMLPPLVLLAAESLDWLVRRVASLMGKFSLLPTAVAVLFLFFILFNGIWPTSWAYLTGQEDQITYFNRFVSGAAEEFNAGQSLEVANLLRERVVPGDSLFIWGFRPEVYYMSGLNPATRFIFQFPLVGSWYPPEWRDEAVDTLWAAMPPYALVLQVDYMPWVTGSNDDSNTLLQGYTEMNNWLIANYERDSQIGNFFIWRRKP